MRCEAAMAAIDAALGRADSPMTMAESLPAEVQAHLEICLVCRAEAHELLGLNRTLRTLASPVQPPPDLVDSVMRQVRAERVGTEALDFEPLTDDDFEVPARAAGSNLPLLGSVAALFALCAGAVTWGEWAAVVSYDWNSLIGWLDLPLPAPPDLGVAPAVAAIVAVLLLALAGALSWQMSTRPPRAVTG